MKLVWSFIKVAEPLDRRTDYSYNMLVIYDLARSEFYFTAWMFEFSKKNTCVYKLFQLDRIEIWHYLSPPVPMFWAINQGNSFKYKYILDSINNSHLSYQTACIAFKYACTENYYIYCKSRIALHVNGNSLYCKLF